MKLLLIACSKHKHRHVTKGPARIVYTGTMFRLALLYAAEQSLEPLILSSKYGFIEPNTVIETYNEKREKPYKGPWPKGSGSYVGGTLYFGCAPSRFTPLVPEATSMGDWVSGIRKRFCCPYASIAKGERPLMEGGVIDFIHKRALIGKITKAQLFEELATKFGKDEGMRRTIDAQLLQSRMGLERLCTIHSDGRYYWITPGLPPRRKGLLE